MNGVLLTPSSETNNINPSLTAIESSVKVRSYLGKSAYSHDALFKGKMEEFRMYPRVLTTSEITCLSNI